LVDTAAQVTREPAQLRPCRQFAVVVLAEHDCQHVGDRALLDHDAAVHVRFAEPQ
jgi:hypothetical protein